MIHTPIINSFYFLTSLRLNIALAFILTILFSSPFCFASAENSAYYAEILRLDPADPEKSYSDLIEQGIIIFNRRDDLVLACIPYEKMEKSGSYKAPDPFRSGKRDFRKPRLKPEPTMDVALPVSGADRILSGYHLPQAYDGTGVVVGFCDIGLDTRHISFRGPDGECRIKRVVRYTESDGKRESFSTPEEIFNFYTDNEDEKHATHVAGIMAGSDMKRYIHDNSYVSALSGVARGAEIVATMSELSDVGILCGVEDIIEYAKESGKPAVINLSLGSYIGPHDGSSLFCQYLDLCAEDAIICLSSGNEGDHTNYQSHPGADKSNPMRVRIADGNWTNFTLYGETDIYSPDGTEFELRIRVSDSRLDSEDAEVSRVYESDPLPLFPGKTSVISSEANPGIEGWQYSPQFAKYFEGTVYVEGGNDPENGRWCAKVMYDCITEDSISSDKPWGRYRLEIIASPVSRVRLDAFADGSHSFISNWHGNPYPPGSGMSISDLATGFKTVSVGMYCTGRDVERFNGTTDVSESKEPMTVTRHSSYGTLHDGRKMPLTVGPGMTIVSSWSGAYAKKNGTGECSALYDDKEGNIYYWGPMTGTSMSSPFVAGVIATWLQANPELSWRNVQDIISETNFFPDVEDAFTNPRYGMGVFNPFEGLKAVINSTEVTGISNNRNSLSMVAANGELTIINPSGSLCTLDILGLDGTFLYSARLGNERTMEIPINQIVDKPLSGPFIFRLRNGIDNPAVLKMVLR